MASSKKILVIDDDQSIVAYLEAKLAEHYHLVSTTDPHKALKLAKTERPDLVLCDIDMPGMGGGDVVAALSEDPETAGIPVLYLTALVSPEEARDMGGNVGGRPGVAKRAPIAELRQRIDELIAG
ncbi:MAG TPA: response regulator [Polaromonas sp.]|uniref:response regulator n=1 Tax=Polaromonas sp. TaxID=1869339 RepID=UPI002D52E71D|nr:response regulator [Polaromonas sp.]HYW55974.1 response regulator [Polaromonas sp.]